MINKLGRQRLNQLFADLERLAADSTSHTPAIQRELGSLRARLLEFERQLNETENSVIVSADNPPTDTGDAKPRPTSPALYGHDQIGFAYSNNGIDSLPASRHTLTDIPGLITSPLTESGQTIGEMQIAPPTDRQLTEAEISLANAVAKQASVQIQSLRLLAAAERARAEAESATRRFMHEGWDSYLDAIHRNERIGYSYDLASVNPYADKLNNNGGIHKPVTVLEQEVGALHIRPDPTRPITDADRELIAAVADQIARQVENIRLLADASRARAEAEEATRRLTREGWQSFIANREDTDMSFVYDSVRVTPMKETSLLQGVVLSQPLLIRGEAVGQLAIADWKEVPAEAAQVATSIAAQASIHIENLRLSEELQKRAKKLEELDRLKSSFLANMSHELRTPLNSILGFADVMLEELDGPLTGNMSNDLQLIRKNGQHLLHLINDVLDMAKIEAGRMNLLPEKLRVHEVLTDVISITAPLASEKNLVLFIEADSDQQVEIIADRTRLSQVMINLINNAIKFTEKGQISIRAKREVGSALISVIDTGMGIPPEQLEVVFQEFRQVDTSTTRKVGGTGLGLPISRRLIEIHGGRIWAKSTGIQGEGSTFFVMLPFEAKLMKA